MVRPSSTAQEKSPVQAELVVATAEPGSLRECFGSSLESGWKILRRCCNGWKRKWVNHRAVIEHQEDQLMRQQTKVDAERAARTPVTPFAHDARGNLVDLRVGNKPETVAGETYEWNVWSFKMRQYVAAVDEETLHRTRGCGCESVTRDALCRKERASEETSATACVHVDDALERSSTPDDHQTERPGEWIRNLEMFPGRVGTDTQRTVPSDADAVAAVSVYGRQRSGLGGVGTTCATV